MSDIEFYTETESEVPDEIDEDEYDRSEKCDKSLRVTYYLNDS